VSRLTPDLTERYGAPSRTNRLLVIAATAAVAVLGLAAALTLPHHDGTDRLVSEPGPTPTVTSETPSASPTPSPTPSSTPASSAPVVAGSPHSSPSPTPTCLPTAPAVAPFTLPADDDGNGYPDAFFQARSIEKNTLGTISLTQSPGSEIGEFWAFARTKAGRVFAAGKDGCGADHTYAFTSGGPATVVTDVTGSELLSPDERLLALYDNPIWAGNGTTHVVVVDVTTGKTVATLDLPYRPLAWLAGSDGLLYGAASSSHTVRRIRLDGTELPPLGGAPLGCPGWDVVGRTFDGGLVAGSWCHDQTPVYRVSEDGTPGEQIGVAKVGPTLLVPAPNGAAVIAMAEDQQATELIVPGHDNTELGYCPHVSVCGFATGIGW